MTGLADTVAASSWYHTMELGRGVVTPGWFDTRTVADTVLPKTLEGRRCLDVGTFDGFWAFEMERRGADAVVAVDIDDPDEWDWPVTAPPEARAAIAGRRREGDGFVIAKAALGSAVERVTCNVYDLDPNVIGQFDLVYVGSLLLHLRDPVRALERVRSVCRRDALLVDAIDLPLTLVLPRRPVAALDGVGRPWWWKPNIAGLVRMAEVAGFEVLDRPRRLAMPAGAGQTSPTLRPRDLVRPPVLSAAGRARFGDPHVALRVRPRG